MEVHSVDYQGRSNHSRKKTVLADDEESFDAHQAGFKLLLEYFMMAPEEQVKRHSDYAQLVASLISDHME